VTLIQTTDQGDTLFVLLLPEVTQPAADTLTTISTVGITTRTAGPMTIPKPPQSMTYAPMSLSGTFSSSQVPQGSVNR
jgi:hypothetical protein